VSYIERAQGDGQALLEDARRLHEYHLRTGESAQQRAIGVLAFGGVLVALIPSAVPVSFSRGEWILLSISLALIVLSLVFAAVVLLPGNARMVEVSDLRSRLHEIVNGDETTELGRQTFQGVHALIYSEDPHPQSPRFRDQSVIGAERRLTQRRMTFLSASVWLMVLGVTALASLLLWVAAATITS
jgi:hypothetical protein